MKITMISIKKIKYETKQYEESLYNSILRIGYSFPLRIEKDNDGYECIDGHKRLSALADILKQDPQYKRGEEVPCIISNDELHSNDCSRGRNTH